MTTHKLHSQFFIVAAAFVLFAGALFLAVPPANAATVGSPHPGNLCPGLDGGPYPIANYDDAAGTVFSDATPDQKIYIKGGLVPCGRSCDDPSTADDLATTDVDEGIDESATCTFCSGFVLFNNIVNAVLFVWMPLIIIILVTWGGVLIMVSGQAPQQRLNGKKIIQWALMGYALMLFSWIIVNTFLSVIGVADWSGIGNWWNPTC